MRVAVLIAVLLVLRPLAGVAGGPPSHAQWSALLNRYALPDGRLDYQRMRPDEDALAEYLELLDEAAPDASWSRNDTKAYWLNLYNASVVALVLQHYPLGSLNDLRIKSANGFSPWEAPVVFVLGKACSLNQIEKQFLRATGPDARIHFALVQAAVSSPPLRLEAYEGDRLEEQLEDQTRHFLNDPLSNQLTGAETHLSSLFDWYAADFGADSEALLNFVNRYAHTPLPVGTVFRFLPFDWHLNDRLPLSNSQALER